MASAQTPQTYDRVVFTRLLDFFAPQAPWQRRLWDIGSLLSLEETLEAAEAVAEGVLTDTAFDYLRHSVGVSIGQDPGIPAAYRKNLQGFLKDPFLPRSHSFFGVRDALAAIREDYLVTWRDAVATGQPCTPDRAARHIAAHLLDAGFSHRFLFSWLRNRIGPQADAAVSLADHLDESISLAGSSLLVHEALVAFKAAPLTTHRMPAEWRTSDAVSGWLAENGFDAAEVRQAGGLLWRIEARDRWSAVEEVATRVDAILARFSVGTRRAIDVIDRVWFVGDTLPKPLRNRERGLEIGSLQRNQRLYEPADNRRIDSALGLLASMQQGPAGPAVAGGWGAIESLLTGPGDKARNVAGDRLAGLVACSIGRAELTTLAFAHAEHGDDALARDLTGEAVNRDKAKLVQQHLMGGGQLSVSRQSDAAALTRLSDILRDPAKVLSDIEQHATRNFRRLYRQRNLVLHWGHTRGVALRATLRSSAPLVGAGIDRVVHGWLLEGVTPLEMSARARAQLDVVGTASGRDLVDLLEPRPPFIGPQRQEPPPV